MIPESLLAQANSAVKQKPPVHLWNPELSGDIDIKILATGEWLHEGQLIERQPLVNLFASILRREADGEYYLLTPVEKWRIQVADTPFMIVDFELNECEGLSQLVFQTNVGQAYPLNQCYPLVLSSGDDVPVQKIDNGLSAKLNRNTFYRLVELADPVANQLMIESAGCQFSLGSIEGT